MEMQTGNRQRQERTRCATKVQESNQDQTADFYVVYVVLNHLLLQFKLTV